MAKPVHFTSSVEYQSGPGWASYVVIFYTDDDYASGYGDNPRRAYWYDGAPECHAIVREHRLPSGLRWCSLDAERRSMTDLERHETLADNY